MIKTNLIWMMEADYFEQFSGDVQTWVTAKDIRKFYEERARHFGFPVSTDHPQILDAREEASNKEKSDINHWLDTHRKQS